MQLGLLEKPHVGAVRAVLVIASLILVGVMVLLNVSGGPEASIILPTSQQLKESMKPPHEGSDDEVGEVTSDVSLLRRCPANATLLLLFPHVPKAGGRSLATSLDSLQALQHSVRHRYISLEQRSLTHEFDLRNSHRTYQQLSRMSDCTSVACEVTSSTFCRRWIFAIREPVARFVSAFYTSTGRKGVGHVRCNRGSLAAERMQDPSFGLEEWAKLPLEERNKCSRSFNQHVHFLAPEVKDPQTQLEVAKQRLSSVMSWVLVMEELQESMQLFQYIFGTELVHFTPTFNYNKYDKSMSAHATEVVVEHNKYDIELYEFALEQHKAQMAAMRADSSDPFNKSLQFECDPEVICWDKSERKGPFWNVLEAPAWQTHFRTAGDAKEDQLCANKRGCWRSDMKKFAR